MSSNNNNIMANAISGKTARACDCCIRRRARWYCAADDAFLCQACDGSVHSANPLARRHERVRLKTASLKQSDDNLPTWHRGLTKRPRTPRHGKQTQKSSNNTMHGHPNPTRIVPDLGVEDTTSFSSSHGDDEEQLLFRVPIYDPFVGELCTSTSTPTHVVEVKNDHQFLIKSPQDGYLPSDLDLEDFGADVETLLGKGLDDESYGIEELGLLDYNPDNNHSEQMRENNGEIMSFGKVVKEENDDLGDNPGGALIKNCEIEVESDEMGIRVPFELTFDYDHDFPTTCDDHHKIMMIESSVVEGNRNDQELCKLLGDDDDNNNNNNKNDNKKVVVLNERRKILLSLDYEAVTAAWATQGSPWINGQRPEISPEDCWPHCLGTCGTGVHNHAFLGDTTIGGKGVNGGIADGGREARVSRYREKRRTRLFSKKIRYEVRKLNAEKRPRMKGRFVKRSSFAPTTTAFPLISKK